MAHPSLPCIPISSAKFPILFPHFPLGPHGFLSISFFKSGLSLQATSPRSLSLLFHYWPLSLTGLTSIEKRSSFLLTSNSHPFLPHWDIALASSLFSISLEFQTFPYTPSVSYNSFHTQNPIQSSWISYLTLSPSTIALKRFPKIYHKRQMYKSRVPDLLLSPTRADSPHSPTCISSETPHLLVQYHLVKNHGHSLELTTLSQHFLT